MERGHERSYDSEPFRRPALSGGDDRRRQEKGKGCGGGGGGGGGGDGGIGQVQGACTIEIKVCGGAVAQKRRTRSVRETGSTGVRV